MTGAMKLRRRRATKHSRHRTKKQVFLLLKVPTSGGGAYGAASRLFVAPHRWRAPLIAARVQYGTRYFQPGLRFCSPACEFAARLATLQPGWKKLAVPLVGLARRANGGWDFIAAPRAARA